MNTFLIEAASEMLRHIQQTLAFFLRELRWDGEDFVERFLELPCDRENALVSPPQACVRLITLATFYLGLCGI